MTWRTVLFLIVVGCGLVCSRRGLRGRLKRILLGRNKDWIAASLGEPVTVSTDTWYYPLDAERRRALAVQFDRNVATAVQVIGPGSF
jgi:hypothetical protein